MSVDFLRKSHRVDLVGDVYFEHERMLKAARWTDISTGGIYIQTKETLPVGDQVKLNIRLPGSEKYFKAAGIVRHRLRLVGMGLQFTHLHPDIKDTLKQLQSV